MKPQKKRDSNSYVWPNSGLFSIFLFHITKVTGTLFKGHLTQPTYSCAP